MDPKFFKTQILRLKVDFFLPLSQEQKEQQNLSVGGVL